MGFVTAVIVSVIACAYGGYEFKWKEVTILYVVLIVFSLLVFVKGLTLRVPEGCVYGFLGRNGAGKSTLIKLLAGAEQATAGESKLGHNVEVEYFAQDQYKVLDPEARMLDDIGRASPLSKDAELRSLLGCFLFSDDDVFKKIGVLSGPNLAMEIARGLPASAVIEALGLAPHPEGGHYRETWRDMPTEGRGAATSSAGLLLDPMAPSRA